MESIRSRMIAVAVTVCLFAVGMAGLLNYFKYRAMADRIAKQRLVTIGKSIENSIHSSLALGLSFAELGTVTSLIERETATHDLVTGIVIFEPTGKSLYSTDQLRAGRAVPASWLDAARRAGDTPWLTKDGNDPAVGIPIKTNYGVKLGYIALRYAQEEIDRDVGKVARSLGLSAASVFVCIATLASFALIFVVGRLRREIAAVEEALSDPTRQGLRSASSMGLFGPALARFFETLNSAESHLAAVRAKLAKSNRP
jgi:hypothetical protein